MRVRIEMDRGRGWETRHEGETTLTAEQAAAQLPAYCAHWPHRIWLNGTLIAEVREPRYLRSVVIRH
jgi:hypothetical protein